VPGDGEQPRPKRALWAPEASQSGHHLQPGVRGNVVGRLRSDHPQVPQQHRLQVAEDPGECRLVAALGSGQRGPEFGAEHWPSIGAMPRWCAPNRHMPASGPCGFGPAPAMSGRALVMTNATGTRMTRKNLSAGAGICNGVRQRLAGHRPGRAAVSRPGCRPHLDPGRGRRHYTSAGWHVPAAAGHARRVAGPRDLAPGGRRDDPQFHRPGGRCDRSSRHRCRASPEGPLPEPETP
jgi:hypothetical protein